MHGCTLIFRRSCLFLKTRCVSCQPRVFRNRHERLKVNVQPGAPGQLIRCSDLLDAASNPGEAWRLLLLPAARCC